jgi:hypothetical protein
VAGRRLIPPVAAVRPGATHAGRATRRAGPRPRAAAGLATGTTDRDAFARAFQSGDVEAIVALLTDDALLTMPPLPQQYQGAVIADRLTFGATIIETGSDSYRPAHSRNNQHPVTVG